jgi:hypothetical protein
MSRLKKVYIATTITYLSDGEYMPYEIVIFNNEQEAKDWILMEVKDGICRGTVEEIESMRYQ